MSRLPKNLRVLFPEYDFDSLEWEADRDLVISRVLAKGDWDAVCWVRERLGDVQLQSWIERRRGRGLDAAQLRFWELVLGIPRRQVNEWLRAPERQVWEQRRVG